MRKYKFYRVDVFTNTPLEGNPLAVFPEAEGLTSEQMQKIARETNLSETTTFVFPPTNPKTDFKVRIFTTDREILFAGHPVLGTHYVLAQEGRIDLKEPKTIVWQELGVGILPVELRVKNGEIEKVIMTQKKPEFISTYDDTELMAKAFSLSASDINDTGLPIEVVSTGIPQLMVPINSLKAMEKIRIDSSAMNEVCSKAGSNFIFLFTTETHHTESTVHTRGFANFTKLFEDPTTGSASGALGAYLVKNKAVRVEPTTYIINEQGYEMKKPGMVYIEVDTERDEIIEVRVGGQVVKVMDGFLYL
jgi:trans-2,3-dihydro-3-hydroxyanthranilate isomerase